MQSIRGILSSQKFQLDCFIDKLFGRLQDDNEVSLGRQLGCSFNDLMCLSGPAWSRTKVYFQTTKPISYKKVMRYSKMLMVKYLTAKSRPVSRSGPTTCPQQSAIYFRRR